jgi:N-acetyl-1-D-myo-inositol-2-amino-2-deoxy-alpha-D-glucopyranoside deacetylase
MTYAPDRRMMLVHAHPDDETITNGATMARYAAEGVHVTLVTCTRGEQGEILVPELAHLAADRDGGLGEHRVTELAEAMRALGVEDHRFLDELAPAVPAVPGPAGAPRRYVDSGMAWGEGGRAVPAPNPPEGAFALADVDEAAGRLAVAVREVRPQVLLTYEPGGGYGHPDHVQAHRVAMRAVELARADGPGGIGWEVPKVYWSVVPETVVREGLRAMKASDGGIPFEGWDPDGPLPSFVVPDDQVTSAVDGSAFREAKAAAMRAHATQIDVDGPFYALSNGVGQPLAGVEFYRLVSGRPSPPLDERGLEVDLFAGV